MSTWHGRIWSTREFIIHASHYTKRISESIPPTFLGFEYIRSSPHLDCFISRKSTVGIVASVNPLETDVNQGQWRRRLFFHFFRHKHQMNFRDPEIPARSAIAQDIVYKKRGNERLSRYADIGGIFIVSLFQPRRRTIHACCATAREESLSFSRAFTRHALSNWREVFPRERWDNGNT